MEYDLIKELKIDIMDSIEMVMRSRPITILKELKEKLI